MIKEKLQGKLLIGVAWLLYWFVIVPLGIMYRVFRLSAAKQAKVSYWETPQ